MKKLRWAIFAAGILGIGSFFLRSSGAAVQTPPAIQAPTAPEPDESWLILKERVMKEIGRFPGTAGIYIKDLQSGRIIDYNPERLFPSASLVKLPIMVTLYQDNANGQISMDETLRLTRNIKAPGSGSLKRVRPGAKLTVRNLIFKMITESDNTATNMLTSVFGINHFNNQFMQLGLSRTNFSRMIMDLRTRDRGVDNYTTPSDMGKLLEMIYVGKLRGSEEMMQVLKSQKVNDRLPRRIPSSWVVAHKTGLMRDSCHDVGIIFSPASDYVVCVLTSNYNSSRRAKKFIRKIGELTSLYYGKPQIHPAAPKPAVPEIQGDPTEQETGG